MEIIFHIFTIYDDLIQIIDSKCLRLRLRIFIYTNNALGVEGLYNCFSIFIITTLSLITFLRFSNYVGRS